MPTPRENRTYQRLVVLFGLGLLSLTLGDFLLAIYEIGAGPNQEVPFPNWADIFYLASYPLLFSGIVVFSLHGLSPASRARVFLDGLLLVVATATFSWFFRLGPVLLHDDSPLLEKIVGAVFPLGDIVLFSSIVLIVGVRHHRELRPLVAVFALAYALMGVPDIFFYQYQSLEDSYPPRGIIDLAWPLGCMLLGLGVYSMRWLNITAGRTDEWTERMDSAPTLLQACIPYLGLPAVAALLVVTRNAQGNNALSSGVYVGAFVLVMLVVVRQVTTLQESLSHARSLERLNMELRTLTATNDELNRTLIQQAREDVSRLADLDRLRNDFVTAVSHDLQTPLTSIRAGLAMLDATITDVLAPDERDLMGAIHRNVERLRLRVNALLTANQLDAGALRLETVRLDMCEVVKTAVAAVQPLYHEKGQTLSVRLPEALLVSGDASRLEEVMINLLANAHRHTPSGSCVIITGQLRASDVQLDVSDNGPGIPADDLDAIFVRFHRHVRGGGSGLGLAIARSLVELHGGRLWAESRLGEGTTFHIRLPRAMDGEQTLC